MSSLQGVVVFGIALGMEQGRCQSTGSCNILIKNNKNGKKNFRVEGATRAGNVSFHCWTIFPWPGLSRPFLDALGDSFTGLGSTIIFLERRSRGLWIMGGEGRCLNGFQWLLSEGQGFVEWETRVVSVEKGKFSKFGKK